MNAVLNSFESNQPANEPAYTPSAAIGFSFEGSEIRIINRDGNPWFVAADIAEQLDYRSASDMTRNLDDDEKGTHIVRTPGGLQQVTVINESGLYSAILKSRKTEAKVFKKWVTSEVLPSIRKTGSYEVQQRQLSPAEMFAASAQLMLEIERKQKQQEAALQAQSEVVNRLGDQVKQIEQTAVLTARPAASEPITHIRPRIRQMYGIPEHVIDEVMRQSPYAPKPAGMVRNEREEAKGGTYAVYWVKDVNACFRRFASECTRVTATKVTHPFIADRFSLRP